MKKKKIALLLFNDVEVLDFAGPFEVFSVTNELHKHTLFNIKTVSCHQRTISARNGLSVNCDYLISQVESAHILIIPGGSGTRKLVNDSDCIDWIQKIAANAEQVLSVCSGALLLAKAKLLDGLKATTHYQVFDELAPLAPDTELIKDTRFVDNGTIVTSAGISAGIDMSLYIIKKLYGKDAAHQTACHMEYPSNPSFYTI